jgi:hypothetical protein
VDSKCRFAGDLYLEAHGYCRLGKKPEIEKTFYTQQSLATADTPKEAQAGLALSNDGWHVPKMF